MPVFPCFDPTSGASGGASSGGGGGGGGGYFDAAMIEADLTDGSWTLFDPSSLVKSVSFDGSRNVITVNAVNSGANAALNWKNSGTRNAPRWYRAATIDGNNVNRGFFTYCAYRLDFDATRQVNCDIVTGLALSGNATTAAALSLGGAFGQIASNAANASYGVYSYSGATSLSTAGPDFGLASYLYGGNKIGGGSAHLVKEVNGFDTSQNAGITRSSNNNITSGGQPLSLVVGLGLRLDGTAWTADTVVKIGIKYLLLKPDVS